MISMHHTTPDQSPILPATTHITPARCAAIDAMRLAVRRAVCDVAADGERCWQQDRWCAPFYGARGATLYSGNAVSRSRLPIVEVALSASRCAAVVRDGIVGRAASCVRCIRLPRPYGTDDMMKSR